MTRQQFAAAISPCLQLVAPVGMDLESQDTWMEAAFKALAGIPIGLLKRGCDAAMKGADHPSKIVPAIMAEVREAWATRRRLAAEGAADSALSLPAPERCTPEQAQEILKEFGLVSRFESHRDSAA